MWKLQIKGLFFFNVKCIYLKKYKINYKSVFVYGLPLFSFSKVESVPCFAALAGQSGTSREQQPRIPFAQVKLEAAEYLQPAAFLQRDCAPEGARGRRNSSTGRATARRTNLSPQLLNQQGSLKSVELVGLGSWGALEG